MVDQDWSECCFVDSWRICFVISDKGNSNVEITVFTSFYNKRYVIEVVLTYCAQSADTLSPGCNVFAAYVAGSSDRSHDIAAKYIT